MSLIYREDGRCLDWASKRLNGVRFGMDAVSIGRERDGELVAVTIFNNFSDCDCHIHIVSDGSRRWLSREYLVAAFSYPFIQCGLRRVTGLVPAKNKAALRFDLRLGFKYEGRSPEAMPDDDIIILGMLRRNCMFIPKKHRV